MMILPPFPEPLSRDARTSPQHWAEVQRAEYRHAKDLASAARAAVADALMSISERVPKSEDVSR